MTYKFIDEKSVVTTTLHGFIDYKGNLILVLTRRCDGRWEASKFFKTFSMSFWAFFGILETG